MLYRRWKTISVVAWIAAEVERTEQPSYPTMRKQNWPSIGGLQEQPINHPAVLRSKALVLNRQGKGGASQQVWIMETNASEPLMKCRNSEQVAKTAVSTRKQDHHSRKPVYWLCGNRYKGGVNIIRAFIRNMGNWL